MLPVADKKPCPMLFILSEISYLWQNLEDFQPIIAVISSEGDTAI